MIATKKLTVEDAAEHLRCSTRFVLDEIRAKNLRASKVGGRWTIAPADLERYDDAHANVAPVRRRSA